MSSLSRCKHASRIGWMAAVTLALGATTAGADTRIMPTRQALVGTPIVVWGNTKLAAGTGYSLDCGNGDVTNGVIGAAPAQRSYIQKSCTYGAAATFTAKLTVGAESASTSVAVINPANPPTSAFDLRNTKINMAIEDGLRFLYFSQFDREGRFDTNQTSWDLVTTSNNPNAFSALALTAIQNHGHAVNGPASDIFQPVVQRGLNYIFDRLVQRDMAPCDEDPGAGVENPCINVPAPVNIGLSGTDADGLDGYATPIYAAAIATATSAAPGRLVDAGLGASNANFVAGKTYAEILQRVVNAIAWGQADDAPAKGGWYYNLQPGFAGSDGSTMGWGLLGFIDSQAAGATIPPFAKTNFASVLANQQNNDGTIDYQVSVDKTDDGSMTKVGIALQGLAFTGVGPGDARVTAAKNYIVTNWTAQVSSADGFQCQAGSPTTHNKGCGYSMFNIFKGLKSYGITTLPGIGRPAGPSPILADDWYADYVDNLLTNQHLPTNAARGEWSQFAAPAMGWSCCENNTTGISSLALLILSPVAFVPPDPILFSTVGLSPATATNLVGTDHTVTAFAQASNNQPVPGATISFQVTGTNGGATGTCVPAGCTTGQDGKVSFTYHDTNGAGSDTIQAFIGALASNQVTKTWAVAGGEKCDTDNDKDVDLVDLMNIRNANGQIASGPTDPRDGNSDKVINVADARYCQLRLHAAPPQ